MTMDGYDDGMGWWMLWGGLLTVLFWGGLFVVIYRIFGATRINRNGVSPSDLNRDSAEDIAGRRLAAGEVNEEEFDRIMSRLGGSKPT